MVSKNSGSGAKRGRTKSTGSLPDRVPTLGGAKLRDWMLQIEAKITAQANEIKTLQKMVKQLRVKSILNTANATSCLQEGREVNSTFVQMYHDTEGSLKKVKKDFETTFQVNINEIAESIQISETKMSASVSELRWTFVVQIQAAAETIDKKINNSLGIVRSDTVRSLVNQVKKIEEIRTAFDQQICKEN